MAKSTRQYVFEGMEILPGALIPFVEKRLESALTGHWQVEAAQRVNGLKPDSNGTIAWDQAALPQRHGPVLGRRVQDRAGTRRTLDRERTCRYPEQALAQRDIYL